PPIAGQPPPARLRPGAPPSRAGRSSRPSRAAGQLAARRARGYDVGNHRLSRLTELKATRRRLLKAPMQSLSAPRESGTDAGAVPPVFGSVSRALFTDRYNRASFLFRHEL